jgi:hypothetical protein
MNQLLFKNNTNISGTYLKGFLYSSFDESWHNLPSGQLLSHLTFEEVLARIVTIGVANNQNIFVDCDKSTFELTGSYRGKIFTLYDYKANRGVNIGGKDLDVEALILDLSKLILATNPTKFSATSGYTGETYSY